MFRNLRVCFTSLLLGGVALVLATNAFAETRVGGKLTGETQWTKHGSPYILTGDILVPEGSTLSIGPGVTVRCKENLTDLEGYSKFDLDIVIEGTLEAHGADGDTIYFTSDAARPLWEDWQGLVVRGKNARASLKAVRIEYSNSGVTVEDGLLEVDGGHILACGRFGIHLIRGRADIHDLTLTNIGNSGGNGIGVWADQDSKLDMRSSFVVGVQNGIHFTRGTTGRLEFSVVSLCTGYGVFIQKAAPVIRNNSITGNEYGIVMAFGGEPEIKQNNLFNNGTADAWLRDFRDEPVKVDLTDNFWGTPELIEVEGQVLDGIDSEATKGFAIVDPFLKEAVPTDASVVGKR